MNKKQKDQLTKDLNKWFEEESGKRDVWSVDSVGRLLKDKLIRLKHWKDLSRGNESKAYIEMQKTLRKRRGYDE